MISYYNGQFIAEEQIRLSVSSPGYQYGYGVFTSFRTHKGKVSFLEKHIERLKLSCLKIGMKFPNVNYESVITELIKLNNDSELRIKVIIHLEENGASGLVVLASKLQLMKPPLRLTIISNSYDANDFRKIKSLNYLENVYLHKQALNKGYNEGLLVNSQNIICECCYANIFFVKEGKIYTPKANNNILNGITRQEFIKRNPVIERDISLDELTSFDQVFITNSVQGIVKVRSIDDLEYNQKI